MIHTGAHFHRLSGLLIAASIILPLTACVSQTLDSNEFRPVGAKQNVQLDQGIKPVSSDTPVRLSQQSGDDANLEPSQTVSAESGNSVLDPAEREKAIAEMRAKAGQESGAKTQIGAIPETAAERLDASGLRALESELKQSAGEADTRITDAELAAKRRSINAMRRKANRHYEDALQGIED